MASGSRTPTLLPLSVPWSSPEKFYISFTELAATSTKTKISKLLRPRVLLATLAMLIIIAYLCLFPLVSTRYTGTTPSSIAPPVPDSPYSDRSHLVIVAGHAIWKGGPMFGEVDEEWTLEDYQKGHNESLTWIDHIRKGVEVAANPDSILIFSGGETRPTSGPKTEAQSYWSLAEALGLLTPSNFATTTTEIYARDSLENLLFSICRFKEYTGRYPESVSVVGYEFKRRRFSEIHREAIRFPEEKFTYIGIDPPDEKLVETVTQFEFSHSLIPFLKDPYACFDEVLVGKRISRGWSQRGSGGYESHCPEISSLLKYCGLQSDGSVQMFDEPLPWT